LAGLRVELTSIALTTLTLALPLSEGETAETEPSTGRQDNNTSPNKSTDKIESAAALLRTSTFAFLSEHCRVKMLAAAW